MCLVLLLSVCSEHGCAIAEGVLCKKVKIRWQEWLTTVVPDGLSTEILRSYHSEHHAGHFGIQLTLEIIRRRFTWEGMHSDILCVFNYNSAKMLSNLVSSIHSTTFTEREDEDHNTVEYDCNKAPPFFEGHHFFLEPIARTCRISVKFDRNKEEITLTASLLRDLVEIFVFFEEHHISFL